MRTHKADSQLPVSREPHFRWAVTSAAINPRFEPLLDSDEASALLKISPKTLQRLARTGEIKGIHIGKLWRFRASDLDSWFRSRIAS